MFFNRYFIFAFFGLSISTAYFVQKWNQDPSVGFTEFASSAPEELSGQIQQILSAGGDVKAGLRSLGAKGAEEVYNCQCAVAGIENPKFQFEDPKNCGPERNYFEKSLSQLPPIFREERAKSSNEFPRVCMTYIMNKFFEGSNGKPVEYFASCANRTAEPQRGSMKACVTSQYVNTVYNYFGDMTDCFGMPQRDFLPKLSNESGLHINTLGGGFDAGLAQFVKVSIADSNNYFEKYRKELLDSKRPSCQRLAPYMKNLKSVNPVRAQRCGLINVPENPLTSFFYLAIKYKRDMESIRDFMARPEFNILPRMNKLGVKSSQIDPEQLQQMLMILGFNAGAKSAVKLLGLYLGAVEQTGRKLQMSDFDFSKELRIYSRFDTASGVLEKPKRKEGETDEELEIRWQKKMTSFLDIKGKFEASPVRYKGAIEPYLATDAVTGETYDTYRISFEPGQLSFAAYLMNYQDSGAKGYLSIVREQANDLNTVFKEGVCVPDSYLKL